MAVDLFLKGPKLAAATINLLNQSLTNAVVILKV